MALAAPKATASAGDPRTSRFANTEATATPRATATAIDRRARTIRPAATPEAGQKTAIFSGSANSDSPNRAAR